DLDSAKGNAVTHPSSNRQEPGESGVLTPSSWTTREALPLSEPDATLECVVAAPQREEGPRSRPPRCGLRRPPVPGQAADRAIPDAPPRKESACRRPASAHCNSSISI